MFAAKEHSLLVPFDGTFDARKAPTAPPKGKDKDGWKERLEDETKKLGEAQERLYADGRYPVLIVLQALDAAGKLVLACYLAESMQSGGDVEDEALDMLIKF